LNIAVVGCGYIGTEVALHWRKKGYHVTATTRNPEHLDQLAQVAQKSLILKGNETEELALLIANNDVLVITLPLDNPDFFESAHQNTAKILKHLALEMDLPRQLIYISNTCIYGDHKGQWVDESCDLFPLSEKAKTLSDSEKTIASLPDLGWSVAILRFSEVYGPGKELSKRVKQLEGHVLPGSGDTYSNMIHLDDCRQAIDFALKHELEGIYNITDDEHPTRKELYDRISHKFQLPLVQWDPSHTPLDNENKRVSNHKIKSEGFAFHHSHRVLD
jgi:nucleoside-diphosphate-sugar epimerase